MDTFTIATINTGHFSFLALGRDPAHARDLILAAWREHSRQTGADPGLVEPDDINTMSGPVGSAWRDGERLAAVTQVLGRTQPV